MRPSGKAETPSHTALVFAPIPFGPLGSATWMNIGLSDQNASIEDVRVHTNNCNQFSCMPIPPAGSDPASGASKGRLTGASQVMHVCITHRRNGTN